jgi:hypothetical protein
MPLPIDMDSHKRIAIHREKTDWARNPSHRPRLFRGPPAPMPLARPNDGSPWRHDRCLAFRHVRRTSRFGLDEMPTLWTAGCTGAR